jgi:hypothetical protein
MQNNLNGLCFVSCTENFIEKKTVKTALDSFQHVLGCILNVSHVPPHEALCAPEDTCTPS